MFQWKFVVWTLVLAGFTTTVHTQNAIDSREEFYDETFKYLQAYDDEASRSIEDFYLKSSKNGKKFGDRLSKGQNGFNEKNLFNQKVVKNFLQKPRQLVFEEEAPYKILDEGLPISS